MNESIERLRAQFETARAAFGRLSQRDQLLVVGICAGFGLLSLVLVGSLVSRAIDKAEQRVKWKTDRLADVMAVRDEYRSREAQRQARLNDLSRSTVRLTSVIEDVARQAGVEIGQLRADDAEPTPDGIIESRVDFRVTNLSVDRLQGFLSRLETSPGVIIMRRLKVTRPYRKDSVDIELTVATYRVKS